MDQPLANHLYSQNTGLTSSSPFIEVFETRDPTTSDINYPVQKRWYNLTTNIEWILVSFSSAGGILAANWEAFSATGALLSIGVPTPPNPASTTISPDGNGLINFTSSDGSVDILGTNGGLGAQDIDFTVSGTTNALQQITIDDSAILIPSGNPNNLTITGNTVRGDNLVHAKPVFFFQTSADTGRIDVQFSSEQAGSNGLKAGLSSFLSTQFEVDDQTGFVQLAGGTTPPVLGVFGDDGAVQLVTPNNAGLIEFSGAVVANGTNTILGVTAPVYFHKVSTSVEGLDIQISSVVAPTPVDSQNCGICCFNNTDFVIDATSGMVSLLGSGSTATLTGNAATVATASGGNINVPGTGNISTTGAGDTLTISLVGTTDHAVQVGNASGSLTSVTPPTNAYSVFRARSTNPATTDPEWVSTSTSFNATFANFNGSYTSQSGRYLRFGNMVFVQINMNWTGNSNFGDMVITNMPFNSGAALSHYPAICVTRRVALPVGTVQVYADIDANDSTILNIYGLIDNSTPLHVQMNASGEMDVTMVYLAVTL